MASEFYEAYLERHQRAEAAAKQGRRVFGYFCNYTPEEIIHAAGILPVRVRGTAENVDLADAHLPSFCCSYMRSALDQALKGHYSYLDGVVFPKTCDMTRALYSIWRQNIHIPYYWSLPVPGKSTDEAVDFFTHELQLFKTSLEEHTGNAVSDEALRTSIRLYNQNRFLMSQLIELSLSDTPPLSSSEVYAIMLSGLVLPKEDHNAMVSRLLDSLPDRSATPDGRVRLMIAGNTFENIEVLQTIEECGADVVIDDLDVGTRYYLGLVEPDADPLHAIARRYLRKIPCPCKHPAAPRLDRILDMAAAYRVRGVIIINQKFCDTHLYDRPWIESRLKEEGLQVLSVEHSDIGWGGGKFRTMVQAFIEMLE
jgi:benzoyl-CoA reductase subunit C